MKFKTKIAAVLALSATLWTGAAALAAEPAQTPTELPVKGMVTLVDVGAATCKPCQMMAPLLEELKGQYQGRAAVVVLDMRQDRQLAARYGLQAIPTQIFYDRLGREAYRHVGFLDKETMMLVLERLLAAK